MTVLPAAIRAISLRDYVVDDLKFSWDEFVDTHLDEYEQWLHQDGDVAYFVLFGTTAYLMMDKFLSRVDPENKARILSEFPTDILWFL